MSNNSKTSLLRMRTIFFVQVRLHLYVRDVSTRIKTIFFVPVRLHLYLRDIGTRIKTIFFVRVRLLLYLRDTKTLVVLLRTQIRAEDTASTIPMGHTCTTLHPTAMTQFQ